MPTVLNSIEAALNTISQSDDFRESSLDFFRALGYDSPRLFDFAPLSFAEFCDALGVEINTERVLASQWKAVHLLFQFTEDELKTQTGMFEQSARRELFDTFNFVALELQDGNYNRTQLANMAREINKPFASPVIVLFKHGATITLASVARREHKTQGGAHVLEKVTLLKDIELAAGKTHRAHLDILEDLGEAKAKSRNWEQFLNEWNRVLDLSALNKKFYRELSNWFFAAREHVKFPDPDENATERGLIRLITRLIFTWFVKERGLVPNALFEEQCIKSLLKNTKSESDSYYRAVLQNLFFATLNTEMNERRFRKENGGAHNQKGDYGLSCFFRYGNEFKAPETWLELVKDVPFLNGGLFECLDPEDKEGARIDGFSDQPKRQAHLPNFLFWGDEFISDLSGVYDDKKQKSVKVKPLLNLLHSYKFTVDENTPLEEDVALDPELLGKVFENLLASYNPETRTTARKQTGSFYTPREIVSYMTEEALYAYLEPTAGNVQTSDNQNALRALLSDTDARKATELGFSSTQIESIVEALQRCTILDPACGSGAFPMGALSKMTALLKKLDPQNQLWLDSQLRAVDSALEATGAERGVIEDAKTRVREAFQNNDPDYARKLYLIERCLFGVDIQSVALQIAKLRFFIALIIDQRIDKTKPNFNIRALPNLETKFVAANTLIALPQTGAITPVDLPALEKELAEVRRKHIAPKSRADKKRLEKEDARLRGEIKSLMQEAGFGDSFITPIVDWNPYDQNAVAPFFEPERMFGPELKDGFDIVIGNPPYVGEKGNKETFRPIASSPLGQRFYMGKMDIFYFFFHVGLDFLKEGGLLAFITTNYYPTATGALKLRQDFKARAVIRRIINFNEVRVFESAMGQHNMVTLLQRGTDPEYQAFVTVENREGVVQSDALRAIVQGQAGVSTGIPQKHIYTGAKDYIVFYGQSSNGQRTIHDLLHQMAEIGQRLDTDFSVNQGIVTGADKVSPKHLREYELSAEKGAGIFVYREEELSQHENFKLPDEFIKPWFKNSDIYRYFATREDETNYRLILTNFITNLKAYPDFEAYLNQFKCILENRSQIEHCLDWWDLHQIRMKDKTKTGEAKKMIFDKPKIVAPQRSYTNTFAYNETSWFASADVYFITHAIGDKGALKFLLGLLNSQLYYWWFYYRGKRKGEMLELYQVPISEAPIPNATPAQQQAIIKLVEQILAAKAADASADTSTQERAIDHLVAELYGLTDEEKTLVGIE